MKGKPEAWRLKVGVAAGAYALIVVVVSMWMYWHSWRAAIEELDQRLLAGAAGVRFVLADDFHDRSTAPGAISVAEDDRNIRELSGLARQSGFKFLYTVIRRGDEIRLTSSSATEEELAARREVRCFDSYDEAQHLRSGVFDATGAVFRSYSDRWGEFRAAFLPEVSPSGNPYVSAAEVDVGYIRAMLRRQLVLAAGSALVLLAASLPLLLIYIAKVRRQTRALTQANERLTREMAERKAMEKEIIRVRNMESLGKLAGGVAHDFNNILAAILGHAELALQSVEPGSDAAADLAEIRRAGERAKDLTRQILAYARKTSSEVKAVHVGAVAREVLGLIRACLPSTVQVDERVDSTASVMASPASVHQILMNLCTNAIQAMAATGGRLGVEVRDVTMEGGVGPSRHDLPPGRYIHVAVSDTGPGIPEEIVDSIFEPYFTTKATGGGSGLGLAVVHGIVTGLGGDIGVRSTPGYGAVFTVLLPAGATTPAGIPETTRSESLPRGRERILVVDDERAIAVTCARTLERLGYRVTMTTDSSEALNLFRSAPEPFDLVLSDVTMPGMTGDRLAAAVSTIRPGVPVILCSGFSELTRDMRGQHGVAKLLDKPISGKDLAHAVRETLNRSVATTTP